VDRSHAAWIERSVACRDELVLLIRDKVVPGMRKHELCFDLVLLDGDVVQIVLPAAEERVDATIAVDLTRSTRQI